MSETDYYVKIKLTADISQAVAGFAEVGQALTTLVEKAKALRAAGENLKSATFDFAKTGSTGIKSLTVDFENAAESAKKTTSSFGEFADKLGFIGRVAAGITVAAIFFETTRAIAKSVESMKEAERTLAALAAIQADTSQEATALRQRFTEASIAVSREFGIAVSDAAKGLEALVKAGMDSETAVKTLRNVAMMAKIEMTDLGVAARNTAMIMAQFGLGANESTRAINALVTMSRLGIGTASDFARGLGVAGTSAHLLGLSVEEAGVFMVALERRLGSAEEAGVRFNRALLELYETAFKLGVPIRDNEGNLRQVADVLMDNIARVRELGGNYELLAQKLSGVNERTMQFYRIMAGVSREELEAIRAEFEKAGRNIDIVWLDAMRNVQTRTDIVWQNTMGRVGEAGAGIVDALTKAAYGMAFQLGFIEKNFTTTALRVLQISEDLGKGAYEKWGQGVANAAEVAVTEMERLVSAMAMEEAITRQSVETTMEFVNSLNISAEAKQRLVNAVNSVAFSLNVARQEAENFGEAITTAGEKTRNAAIVLDTLMNMLKEVEDAGRDTTRTLKEMTNVSDPTIMLAKFIEWGRNYETLQTRTTALKNQLAELIAFGVEGWQKYGQAFQDYVVDMVVKGNISAEEAVNMFKTLRETLGDIIPLDAITNTIMLADKQREAAKEAEKHAKELERLKEAGQKGAESIMDIVRSFFEGAESGGMFSSQLGRINQVLDELEKKGVKLDFSQALNDVLKFIADVNRTTIEISIAARGFDFAGSVAGSIQQAMRFVAEYSKTSRTAGDALKYVISTLKEKNALSQEEAVNVEKAINFLARENVLTREQVSLLRVLTEQRKNGLTITKEWMKFLEDLEEQNRGTNKVAWEMNASIERLGRIQQFANMQGGFLNLTLQALQLAFYGGADAAKMVIPYLQAMNSALKDGYISAEEESEILRTLGLTFNEQGKPVLDFTGMLETLISTISNTVDAIGGLINALNSIPTNIVVTITTQHVTAGAAAASSGGEPAGTTAAAGFTGAPGDFWAYQSGAWYTPEGLAYLHRGEMVLPQPVAEWFRKFGVSQMTSNINVNLNISAAGDAKTIAETVSREILRRVRSIQGGYMV